MMWQHSPAPGNETHQNRTNPSAIDMHWPSKPRDVSHNTNSTGAEQATNAKPVKKKRIRVKTERRREQCRRNQARYRHKQRQYGVQLETYVAQLREQVEELETQRHALLRQTLNPKCVANEQAAMAMVHEIFQVCRHGCTTAAMEQQLAFLRTSMATNVCIGTCYGVDAVLEQWQRLANCLEDFTVDLMHCASISVPDEVMDQTAPIVVRCHQIAATFTITTRLIDLTFPHLVGTSLQALLTGRSMAIDGSADIEIQSQTITRIDFTLDFLPPLLQLVGSVHGVAMMLQPEASRILEINQHQERPPTEEEEQHSTARTAPIVPSARHRLNFIIDPMDDNLEHNLSRTGGSSTVKDTIL